jgi:hypothetical protein
MAPTSNLVFRSGETDVLGQHPLYLLLPEALPALGDFRLGIGLSRRGRVALEAVAEPSDCGDLNAAGLEFFSQAVYVDLNGI